MLIHGICCSQCRATIYSRANHDLRSCPCGKCYVDGGQGSYLRVGYEPDIEPPEHVEIELEITIQELYDDWNTATDKYGVVE